MGVSMVTSSCPAAGWLNVTPRSIELTGVRMSNFQFGALIPCGRCWRTAWENVRDKSLTVALAPIGHSKPRSTSVAPLLSPYRRVTLLVSGFSEQGFDQAGRDSE